MIKRRIVDLLTVVISLAIAAAALEALTRFVVDDGMQFDLEMWKYARDVKEVAADPVIGHVHAPNRQARLMGVDFRTNSKGLRDREIPYERTPGKRRILMLGDSLTVGWGVAANDTFAKRIERLYAAEGINVETVNAGVGNYNTIQEVQAFFAEGYRYKPDVIVLNFFVNDAEIAVPAGPPSAWRRACSACVFIAGRYDAVMRRFFGKMDWATYYLSLYEDGASPGWRDARNAIARLAEFARSNRITLLIASLPELHDIEHYRFQRITDLVHEAADQERTAFVDLLPYLRAEPSSKLWVTPPDPHPNARAHQLIAQGLFEALRKLDNGP